MTIESNHDQSGIEEALAGIQGVAVIENEPLASHVTMRVGGPARWFVTVESAQALVQTVACLCMTKADWFVLGGGSNTIFGDDGYAGVVIAMGEGLRSVAAGPGENQVTAGAAASLAKVMRFAQQAGLSGLEFVAGIPGSFGGALAGNAGAWGESICVLVESVQVIDREGRLCKRRRGEFDFAYRSSALRNDLIVEATLGLKPDDPEAIARRIADILAKRREQPTWERCSGCVFKNPPGDSAGRLIDAAGLKGARVGGASVSERHTNFIVNDGTATTSDIQSLIDTIRRRVADASGVHLELEVRMPVSGDF